METIHEGSGHSARAAPVLPHSCPAGAIAGADPHPVVANSAEGVKDPPSRTKIKGNKIMTVGSCFKTCHGNEPGTSKEVVSFNTTGPCFLITGAPTVIIELGMAGITGSTGMMNKGAGG